MCSYSTQKSLEKLDFIESITPDLEATSFKLEFKDGDFVDFDGVCIGFFGVSYDVFDGVVVGVRTRTMVCHDRLSAWSNTDPD